MFPSLPTDNLYKFSFVGSLFLIILIVYSNMKKEELLTDTYNQFAIENIKQDNVLKENEYLLKSIKYEVDNMESWNTYTSRKGDSLKSLLNEYSKKLMEVKGENSILRQNIKSVEKKLVNFYQAKKFWNTLIFILSITMVLSGIGWYFKVQYYQDTILKNESLLKQNQVDETNETNKTSG